MKPTVTEKAFLKMLISSAFGILLCMVCLVGAAWAWFTVDIRNADNVIQIGTPEVTLTLDDAAFTSGTNLAPGSHTIQLTHSGDRDDFQQKSTLYVTLTLDGSSVYTVLSAENLYARQLTLELDRSCTLTYSVSWFAPANALRLMGDTLLPPTQTQQESTEPVVTEPVAADPETP